MTDRLNIAKTKGQLPRKFKRIGQIWTALTDLLGVQKKDGAQDLWQAEPSDLYVQTVTLPVTSLSAARKIISLQISRLSPSPPELILWDVIQNEEPLSAELQSKNAYVFKLGIARKEMVDSQASPTAIYTTVSSSEGEQFNFENNTGLEALGRQILWGLAFVVITYVISLWAMSQWADRLQTDARSLNQQSSQLTQDITQKQNELAGVLIDLGKLESYAQQTANQHTLKTLSKVSGALSDIDSLSRLNITSTDTNLTITTDNPSGLQDRLSKAFPTSDIQQSQVSSDRRSSQSRVVIRITPVEDSFEISKGSP